MLNRQRSHAVRRVAVKVNAVATPVQIAAPDPVIAPRPDVAMPSMEDPWSDPKWKDTKWTVYRDVAYDLQPFVDKHPGGNWLLNLSIQRDCTALIESYHLRPEVSEARFKGLPVLEDFPVGAVPKSPRPNDSPLYNSIRQRVRKELFPKEGKQMHRQGGDFAAATIIGTAVVAYALYANNYHRRIPWLSRRVDRPHDPALRQPWCDVPEGVGEQRVGDDGRLDWRFIVNVAVPPPSLASHSLQRQRLRPRRTHCDAASSVRRAATQKVVPQVSALVPVPGVPPDAGCVPGR